MKSAITFSAVTEAAGGPFVLWDSLKTSMELAKELGFDAIEIFPPGPEFFLQHHVGILSKQIGIQIAAIGSGAGWVKHKLSLADADPAIRTKASEFLQTMLEAATDLGAPLIIGSMQGRSGIGSNGEHVSKPQAKQYLRQALEQLDKRANSIGGRILYEPLNRYETDQCNTLAQGSEMIHGLLCTKLLADWFHMNIEEDDLANAILRAAEDIGHVHFADSNRRAVGLGHLQVEPLIQALRSVGYRGFLSAEVFALPDPRGAAAQTIRSFKQFAT